MENCIVTIEEATPAWLTEILSRRGSLSSGRVQSLTVAWLGWASNGRYVRRALTGFHELACDEVLSPR